MSLDFKRAYMASLEVKWRVSIVAQTKYTAEFKSKIILAVLQGDRELHEICSEYSLQPDMVSKWKQEFLKNAHFAFSTESDRKEAKRKEKSLKRDNDRMRKTVGQLTLERNFLQDCFRQVGAPLPTLPEDDC